MINIKGIYNFTFNFTSMFINKKITITGYNLITFYGESFFMNRCINDKFNPIEYILLGNGTNNPTKEDITLGNETSRKKCTCLADLNKQQLILNAQFKASEVIGTSEIGVATDKILISHDVYEKYTNEQLIGFSGDVDVTYVFQFVSGCEKRGFNRATGHNGLYYIPEENMVIGVIENGDEGYHKTKSLAELETHRGAYYYDYESKNLYINPLHDDSLSRELIIQTKR